MARCFSCDTPGCDSIECMRQLERDRERHAERLATMRRIADYNIPQSNEVTNFTNEYFERRLARAANAIQIVEYLERTAP